MKRVAMLLAVVFTVVAAFAYVGAVDKGPENITINVIQEKKAPVEFKHHEHQKRVKDDCKACHHATKEGEQPEKCSKCHMKEAAGDTPDFKKAMHDGCKDCHKKEKAAGKNAPTKCKECHVE